MKLLWSDVDLAERAVTVRETKNEDDRVVPLSNTAYEILDDRKREWQEDRRRTDVVDPKAYGTLADIRQVLDRAMKKVSFNADRRAWLRPIHSLRDTFITNLARHGIPLDRRMKLSGHCDPAMNLAYGEVKPTARRDAMAQTFDRELGA